MNIIGVTSNHGCRSTVTCFVRGTSQGGSHQETSRSAKIHFGPWYVHSPFLAPTRRIRIIGQVTTIMDAKRISDGSFVTLKTIETNVHPFEVAIGHFLSSEQIASDPRNQCVRILDTLQDPIQPDVTTIVMPYLRKFNKPPFQTFGEAISCFRQLIQVRSLPRVTMHTRS